MSKILLMTSIITYILSLTAALIFTFAAGKLSKSKFRFFAFAHLFFVLLFALFMLSEMPARWKSLSSLLGFASGMICSGWAIRSAVPLPLKIYFGAFLLTIPVFIMSPTLIFYGISGRLADVRQEQELDLGRGYYLVEQQAALKSNADIPSYKVIRKYGIYNKTIARELNFGARANTVKVLYLSNDSVSIRAYTSVNNRSDSADVQTKPVLRPNTITRKQH